MARSVAACPGPTGGSLGRRALIALTAALAPLGPSVEVRAEPRAPVDPATLIAYQQVPADRITPLPGTARPFAEAKARLARGDPKAALEALKKDSGGLLADREWLLRADAKLALGDKKGAVAAYEKAIELARVEDVALLAARGLVDVLGDLGERDRQLSYVDALLTVRRIARR